MIKKLSLGAWDVIHAFPTSGKSALVLSLFKELGRSVIDTDVILFGFIMPNAIQHEIGELALPKPWKQTGAKRHPLWKSDEALAMMVAGELASKVGAPILTNLVSTLPYVKGKDRRITIAPTLVETLSRHEKRAASGAKSSTDPQVVTSWHASYMKHVSQWPTSVMLGENEFLCDVFGVRFAPDFLQYEDDYYQWVYGLAQELFPHWDVPKWAHRLRPKG